jgi:hypothetical protein
VLLLSSQHRNNHVFLSRSSVSPPIPIVLTTHFVQSPSQVADSRTCVASKLASSSFCFCPSVAATAKSSKHLEYLEVSLSRSPFLWS